MAIVRPAFSAGTRHRSLGQDGEIGNFNPRQVLECRREVPRLQGAAGGAARSPRGPRLSIMHRRCMARYLLLSRFGRLERSCISGVRDRPDRRCGEKYAAGCETVDRSAAADRTVFWERNPRRASLLCLSGSRFLALLERWHNTAWSRSPFVKCAHYAAVQADPVAKAHGHWIKPIRLIALRPDL